MLFLQGQKGTMDMENTIVKEATEILSKLSPQNQIYFMTLVRAAEAAENNGRRYSKAAEDEA